MANEEHVKILRQGADAWNAWREENQSVLRPDLSQAKLNGARLWEADLHWADLPGTDLSEAFLGRAQLYGADLRGANLQETVLDRADLSRADLRGAKLRGASLFRANLQQARLTRADLSYSNLLAVELGGADLRSANLARASLYGANLTEADLTGAKLIGASLGGAILVRTILKEAQLTDCFVYGVSVWDLVGVPKDQSNLVITPNDVAAVTVDDLKVAQFIYLLLYNPNIRDVIDTIGKKGVLILGRFGERLAVLNALRQKLRETGYAPMVFDFERAESKDFTETVKVLAGMSAFIIADLTKPRSVQQELQATIPDYMTPFVPIIQKGEKPYSMFKDLLNKYKMWVLDLLEYDDVDQLVRVADTAIIERAETRRRRLLAEKAEEIRIQYAADFE